MQFLTPQFILIQLIWLFALPVNAQILHFEKNQIASPLLANQIGRYEIFDLDIDQIKSLKNNETSFSLKISLDETRVFDLILEESEVLNPSLSCRMMTEQGSLLLPPTDIKTYHGHEAGSKHHKVALTQHDEYLSLHLFNQTGSYILEPLSIYDGQAPAGRFVFYHSDDIDPSNAYACKKSDLLSEISDEVTHTRSSELACLDIELAIVVDYQMYTAEGSTAVGVLNTLATIYNLVSLDFDNEFNDQLNIRIKEVVISVCAACDQWSTTNNVGHALDAIRDWGEGGGFNETYDIGIFWTTRVFDDNFAGLAYQDQVCEVQRYIAVRKYTPNNQSLRIMMSHEIGHSLGCGHNYEIGSACESNPGRDPRIMDPIVDPTSVGWTVGTQSCDQNSTLVINNKINNVSCLTACQTITCSPITNLIVNNISQTGVTVSWSGTTSSYNVRLKEEGASNYLYNNVVSSSSVTINTALEYCKQYHISVQALCGSGADPMTVTELVEIPGGAALEILYVEPKNCDQGTYDLEVIVEYQNTVPGGFNIVANGTTQVFSYTSSPQTVNVLGLVSSNNNNALLEAFGVANSGPACTGTTNYVEPNASCAITINEFFNNCELPYQWTATSSNSSVFSENFEWKFNDGNRTLLNYGAASNAGTSKTINGSCAAYFDDDIFMNSTYTGSISLESKAYDLTNLTDVYIELDYNFHNFEDGKDANNSEFSIDVFNGSSWVNVMFDNDDVCTWFNVWPASCTTNFSLNVDAYSSNQFKVRFNYTDGNNGDWTGMVMIDDFKVRGVQLGVLSLSILDFDGELEEDAISLHWDIEKDNSFSHYILERSNDGNNFEEIVQLDDVKEYLDTNPMHGANYYKLKVVNHKNEIQSSNAIKIEYTPKSRISVYPNPSNLDIVKVLNTTSVVYTDLSIYNLNGQLIITKELNTNLSTDVDVSSLSNGMYLIKLSNASESKTLRFVRL